MASIQHYHRKTPKGLVSGFFCDGIKICEISFDSVERNYWSLEGEVLPEYRYISIHLTDIDGETLSKHVETMRVPDEAID